MPGKVRFNNMCFFIFENVIRFVNLQNKMIYMIYNLTNINPFVKGQTKVIW